MQRVELKAFIFFIYLLSLTKYVSAQTAKHEILFSQEIQNQIESGKMRPSSACYYYSYIGEYAKSIESYDIPISWGVDSLDLSQYQIMPAIPKIIEEAKNHQLIVISESHLKPQHRVFAKIVIDSLADYGFNHLGIETLTPDYAREDHLMDTLLNSRKYALNSPLTGFYTREAQMSNLIRQAKERDYQLFAYERAERIPGKDRDEIQADNIIRYLERNNFPKTIILCGWHHSIESEDLKRGKSHWMAYYLKSKTDLDPLTIYQDNFTEKSFEKSHPILDKIQINTPSVFMHDSGKIAQLSDQVDIEVIHPKTSFQYGRPLFLFENKEVKAIMPSIEQAALNFPIILSAYIPEEYPEGVPVDRIEWSSAKEKKSLVLKTGTYLLELEYLDEKKEMKLKVE